MNQYSDTCNCIICAAKRSGAADVTFNIPQFVSRWFRTPGALVDPDLAASAMACQGSAAAAFKIRRALDDPTPLPVLAFSDDDFPERMTASEVFSRQAPPRSPRALDSSHPSYVPGYGVPTGYVPRPAPPATAETTLEYAALLRDAGRWRKLQRAVLGLEARVYLDIKSGPFAGSPSRVGASHLDACVDALP